MWNRPCCAHKWYIVINIYAKLKREWESRKKKVATKHSKYEQFFNLFPVVRPPAFPFQPLSWVENQLRNMNMSQVHWQITHSNFAHIYYCWPLFQSRPVTKITRKSCVWLSSLVITNIRNERKQKKNFSRRPSLNVIRVFYAHAILLLLKLKMATTNNIQKKLEEKKNEHEKNVEKKKCQ